MITPIPCLTEKQKGIQRPPRAGTLQWRSTRRTSRAETVTSTLDDKAQDARLCGAGSKLLQADVAGGEVVFADGRQVADAWVGDGVVLFVCIAVASEVDVSNLVLTQRVTPRNSTRRTASTGTQHPGLDRKRRRSWCSLRQSRRICSEGMSPACKSR